MTAYTVVKVTPDTPEWERERRNSVGASEVAAIMGLSSYGNTALDVYKHKLGIDRPFDPLLAWIGHQSEPIIEAWLREFSGLDLDIHPGFMARSVEHPYLHASFDRVCPRPFTPIQMKTAHHYSGHHWDEGIPTDIRVQVQAEMAVSGASRALVVVWIGGREFRLFWEPRDDRFINEHLIPTVRDFWDANVRARVPPQPSTLAELNEVYITQEVAVEASDSALEAVERRAVLLSDIESMQAEADALKLAIGNYMGPADTLTHHGRKVLTFKTQKGRQSFDKRGFEADHPDLVAAYTTQGAPFRVMRTVKQKEQNK
ncbi:lambda-exonuclease family protein [Microbacterium sp.]|uniref:YqaJ viral recombinase family nuclease n=1 Tax=Microbacterium sp. TaxID=51671 RepID=UPI0032420747